MLTEGAGWWKKASVECVFKWVAPALVCVGRPPPQCPTHRNPSSHWSSSCGVEGGESRGERGMTGTHSAFYSSLTQTHTHTKKTLSLLSFSSDLSNISCSSPAKFLLPALTQNTQIPTAWDKEEREKGGQRERERERERGERWWDASVSVTWRLRAKGGDVAHVCVCVCARALRSASAFVCVVPRVCLLSFLRVQ